jgi:hypothetical protein
MIDLLIRGQGSCVQLHAIVPCQQNICMPARMQVIKLQPILLLSQRTSNELPHVPTISMPLDQA